jgi:hypothetical protein
MALQAVGRHLARGREHGECDGQVEPPFRTSAGARFTVIRRSGQSSSALEIPLRTRSLAS